MTYLRLAALFAATVIGPSVLANPGLEAREVGGGCSQADNYGCITTKAAYAEKTCDGGGGVDCITCVKRSLAVCTWAQGGDDLPGYWSN